MLIYLHKLQGYEEKKNAYIAAQGIERGQVLCVSINVSAGPVEVSVERFWRMIWEYEVKTIVMLTQCSEAGKVCMPAENICTALLSSM